MDSGLYAAYTGLLARTQALDTAANNLANAGTVGFRAQREFFSSVLAAGGINTSPSQVGEAVNDFGVLGGNLIDQGQGAVTATGNPLDIALNGPGFFAIQSNQSVQYTRDGGFLRSDTGVLETAKGEPVLDTGGQPITIPSGTVNIAPDGSISVTSAGISAIAGQIGVYGFSPGTDLIAQGTNRFVAPDGVQPAVVSSSVQQGGSGRSKSRRSPRHNATDPGAAAGRDDAEGVERLLQRFRQNGNRGAWQGIAVKRCDT